ncbi:variant erythrocyte surface antigen-1 alpha subunit [Babesia bovis T2Bo]|uniref:variant erythrocyte surface antigen-1 alpha subunit n=1 Tax=Babesia bovis T2Bo TaxID=484906 RepID=UPI001C3657A2|nr:variant erythrocyte surface antigen-1 alpha subunit [Babesia bovis T2Bo]EDO07797.2 variant erythrocyte surface antigen-1 alpha subunit [Babesia bovis T2Bo]
MAVNSTFTPKASLTEAPTNLKEAIDWVLRVTGRDGKKLDKDECICGLAAAVTDLLQSVELEYHGEAPNKGASQQEVKGHLNELFSLVQGLGGTAVVRTYIDQLAQVLSALVGWSKIDKCWDSKGNCKVGGNGYQHGIKTDCEYLKDVKENTPCKDCGCMKWEVTRPDDEGTPLGRKCTRCSSGGSSSAQCSCSSGGGTCSAGKDCKCAKEGKCCKCCCNSGSCKDKCQKDAKCSCDKEDRYRSAYPKTTRDWADGGFTLTWVQLVDTWMETKSDSRSASLRRHHCARILLGSVCLIWSGLTYMYWTGKWAKGSPRWNNHILDGSGLDDGTLSQWLQALGFPRDMINNSGPRNRWDAVIWDGFRGMLYLGFPDTGNGSPVHGGDYNDNTFRNPAGMNYAGYIHTVDRGAFCSKATVFNNGTTSITEENINKCGALYKLYILSCAYFTGLQQKDTPQADNKTPRTIREILYWLSALPYSQAYKDTLDYAKEVLKKVAPDVQGTKTLSFLQTGRTAPITVHEYNLFAHFQAVTQYCPLVLIGIQGGIHSSKSTDSTKEPPIHSLYANTECNFTYPTVSIQAYNQVVHYIRALFYQLYFLRKQCAMKVAQGGKWRECRYGKDVVSKGVISWMCLGCSPMEHDRTKRVDKVKEELGKVVKKVKLLEGEKADGIEKAKALLVAIGDVVVQLGNAQEALEGKKTEGINAVKEKLTEAKGELEGAKEKLDEALTGNGGGSSGILKDLEGKLDTATGGKEVDPGKNEVSKAIHKVWEVLKEMEKQLKEVLKNIKDEIEQYESDMDDNTGRIIQEKTFYKAVKELISICNSPKCPSCKSHSNKCGRQPQSKYCDKCHQQYMDGTPSPLQAFLEDRLPGFSCEVVRNTDTDKDTVYPSAASHLGHCNGSGQCCPLPMGFRNNFQDGVTQTGQRLYGILYFFSNGDMMQSCVYTLVRVTAALSATTPQVLGDVFGFFRGGVGEKEKGKTQKGQDNTPCKHEGNPSDTSEENRTKYFCGWCASGLRDEVKKIEWIQKALGGKDYRTSVGTALIDIKGDKDTTAAPLSSDSTTTNNLSTLTKNCQYLSPLTGELYTAVSATFGGTYLSWVLYLSDALHSGLESLSEAFRNIECRGCKGNCDPNKCKKGAHGQKSDTGSAGLCRCQSIVSCTGVLPVLYRHGFSYGNPFNLEGYRQGDGKDDGDYSIMDKTNDSTKKCHQFLDSLSAVIKKKEEATPKEHPLTKLLSEVGKLQYDIRLPWIFVLTLAWLVAVLYLAFGAIWPLDWTHMRSHWLRGGEHQWQCMWYKVMTGRKGMELVEYFGKT